MPGDVVHTEETPANGQPLAGNGAVAQPDRDPLAARLAEALIESGDAEVVATLLAGRSAECPEPLLLACLDRLPHDEAVHEAMIARELLPPSVVQRLAMLASDRLRAQLAACHPLPPAPERELGELGPDRPRWWSQHLAGMFR